MQLYGHFEFESKKLIIIFDLGALERQNYLLGQMLLSGIRAHCPGQGTSARRRSFIIMIRNYLAPVYGGPDHKVFHHRFTQIFKQTGKNLCESVKICGENCSPQEVLNSYQKSRYFCLKHPFVTSPKDFKFIRIQTRTMKIGKNDKRVQLRFTPEELDFLQDNTWQMAESFGLDTRISNLTGKRAVGFYRWDLECLEDVTEDARKDAPVEQHPMIDGLLTKIREAERLT
ncbi:MAG: hypothetical protein ACKVU2_08890 [Saprospiraceae bacterium]